MNQIIFLGTGGARWVVMRQIRASGGIWFALEHADFILDPGPGALVKATGKRKIKLDPCSLDAVILSHRHLDHCADANILVEAMTEGGFKRRGAIFAPRDALEEDPVVLRYLQEKVPRIVCLEAGQRYALADITLETPFRHPHGTVETYGINFHIGAHVISYIADTRFTPDLITHYRGDILIINVVRYEEPEGYEVDHLNISDAKTIITEVQPNVAFLTHFGMTMIQAKPWEVAARLSEETGVQVVAARDGMVYPLP